MAVQPWELAPEHELPRPPRLRLVAPPPSRGGRVVAAVTFVVLLTGAVGFPVIRAAVDGPPAPRSWSYRTPALAQVDTLDTLPPMTGGNRPTSTEPAGGIAYVSCTNLWTALPDGSHARKLLKFPGISSPAFSPDARTIAFVGPTDEGSALFMVAADGAQLTEIGTFSSGGIPIGARVANLTWSPRGNKLAFALIDSKHDPWSGGSTIWLLTLATGEFEKVSDGWPAPAFVNGRVVFSQWLNTAKERGASFSSPSSNANYTARKMSSEGTDLTLGIVPDNLSDSWTTRHGAVVLRHRADGELELAVKRNAWAGRDRAVYTAPFGHEFFPMGRVSVAQDSRRAVVDLVDGSGERDLGILDLTSGEWTVLDYAWSGVPTTAPTSSGPLGAARALRLAGDVLGGWGRGREYAAAALLVGDPENDLITGNRNGYVAGASTKTSRGWTVPATLFARKDGQYRYQQVVTELTRTRDQRIEATVDAISRPRPLRTIEDARRFVTELDGGQLEVAWPSYLPDGVKLNQRWPVDAYSWDGHTTATIHLIVPGEGAWHGRTLNLAFGDVSFNLGCGGENDPEEQDVGGQAGLFDHIGRGAGATRQILWPATLEQRDIGRFSVYGEVSRETLVTIAESMVANP